MRRQSSSYRYQCLLGFGSAIVSAHHHWLNRSGPVGGTLGLQLRVILLGLLFGVMQSAAAGTALDQLNYFVDDIDTFQAEFEQTLYDSDSQPLQSSIGTVRLKRPGRFIWSYTSPESQDIIADGERIWLYDKDLEQVTVNDIDDRVAGTPLALLIRSAPLSETFDIEELGDAEGVSWLELTPKEATSDFEQVFIGLNDAGLAAMELRDNFGQATQILFTEFEPGIELADSLFEFVPPDGVDVIGLDGQ